MDCGIPSSAPNNPYHCYDVIDLFRLSEEERKKQIEEFRETLKGLAEQNPKKEETTGSKN